MDLDAVSVVPLLPLSFQALTGLDAQQPSSNSQNARQPLEQVALARPITRYQIGPLVEL
jgi:hypothetical protein